MIPTGLSTILSSRGKPHTTDLSHCQSRPTASHNRPTASQSRPTANHKSHTDTMPNSQHNRYLHTSHKLLLLPSHKLYQGRGKEMFYGLLRLRNQARILYGLSMLIRRQLFCMDKHTIPFPNLSDNVIHFFI